MKLLLFIVICVTFPRLYLHGQIADPVHLWFNLNQPAECDVRKIDMGKTIHFYIDGQHFVAQPPIQSEALPLRELDKTGILNIREFIELANKERKQLIMEGERRGSIRILFNNEVFQHIYLYEKQKGERDMVKRYQVIWKEEVE